MKKTKQEPELFTARNYVAKHMNAINIHSVEIDRKKQQKTGQDRKHKNKILGDY